MDDSPRSSKRRRLDPAKRIFSSPLAKPSTQRGSGRLTNRSVSYNNGAALSHVDEVDEAVPKSSDRSFKSASNGTPGRRAVAEEIDIYDDIEGAFTAEPSPRPTRRQLQSREGAHNATRTPTITRWKPTQTPATVALKSPTSKPSGRRKREQSPADKDEESTGQNGTGGTRSGKLPSAKKTTARASRQAPSEETDAAAATPSRASKRRKPIEERTTIPETNDESDAPAPPSSKKRTASARRRFSRTDHVNNQDDEHWSDAEGGANMYDEDDIEGHGNSVSGSVLDPTEPSPFNKPPSTQKEKAVPLLLYNNIAAGRELDLLKTIVMERITGKRPSPLVGLDDEYRSVYQVIEQTITAGEGNSMLVIGARGSGKTALVNKVLSKVSKDNRGEYHVVRLSGFIHTDDKIALREIWRQLGKEMDIEEDGSGPGKNYADTLATLLALLSHPSEQTGEVNDQVAKAIIFVMDEFDLFAHHPRQTLLYNLFDIAQSRKAPIVVLGLTTRIDVTNSLEKRVKSRFSHRYVHLSLAKTFTAFREICKACLTIQLEDLNAKERGILEGGTKATSAKKGKKSDAAHDVLSTWNANINKLFATPSFLTTHLAPTFYLSKSVPAVLTTFLLPTATLSPTHPFHPLNALSGPDSKLTLIPQLSTLALSLLIAAARLDIIHDSDTCNFNMAYDEYASLASRARIQSAAGGMSSSSSTSKVWGKDVARREWEALGELGLVIPVVGGQVGAFGMVRCDVALEEVGEVLKGERGVDRGLERWCRSL